MDRATGDDEQAAGWAAFAAGDLEGAATVLPQAARFIRAWQGEPAEPGARLGDSFLDVLAEVLHAAADGVADPVSRAITEAADPTDRWLAPLVDLAVALAWDRWDAASAAADDLAAVLERSGRAPHLVQMCRSTKWERLTGSPAYASGSNAPEAAAWIRILAAFRHHARSRIGSVAVPPPQRPMSRVDEVHADPQQVLAGARAVLEQAWNPARRCCYPNRYAYPHQWLWDSSFNSVAWSAFGDPRAVEELESLFEGQQADGFMPHIRYSFPATGRGPLSDRSSFTQPPIYAHALRVAHDVGLDVPSALVDASGRALDHLWEHRRHGNGLLFVVHPWETGVDDSPRWDDWFGIDEWDIDRLSAGDRELVDATTFDANGIAIWNERFVACSASFNALTAWAFAEHAALTGDRTWAYRSQVLTATIDRLMWNDDEALWDDIPIVGGGPACRIPTLDATLPVLTTTDESRRARVLAQWTEPTRFASRFGRRFLPDGHPQLAPTRYWRGPTWPQLEYVLWRAAMSAGETDTGVSIADAACRGVLAAGFSEYWNPDTGRGHGGKPYTWSAVTAHLTRDLPAR